MLSEQGQQQQSFDPVSDYSPTMLHQQQHFATGHQQQHHLQQKQQQPQQQYHRSARPASEILPQNHHHPFLANNFQSPEGKLHTNRNKRQNSEFKRAVVVHRLTFLWSFLALNSSFVVTDRGTSLLFLSYSNYIGVSSISNCCIILN
jgi:hypothetical protein